MNETCIKHALNMPDIGGCPYCEIDRLKAELEDAKDEAFKREARIMMYVNQVCALEHHLAEARAEVDNIKQVEFPRRIEKLRAEARQEAARECLLLFYLALDESISFEETYIKGVKSIKAKFGLEG